MTEEREKEIRGGLFCWHKAQRDIVREILAALDEAREEVVELGEELKESSRLHEIGYNRENQLRAQLTQAQADCADYRFALEKLRDGPGNSMSIWQHTWAHEYANQALLSHSAGAELLKELEGLREKVKTARDEALEEAAQVSKKHGYTFAHSIDQPWGNTANYALRTQNNEIAKQIRALKSEVRG